MGGIAVSGITYADVATEGQIAISMSRSEAMRTVAKVVLTNKILLGIDETLLFCDGAILKTAKEIGELLCLMMSRPIMLCRKVILGKIQDGSLGKM